MTDPDRTIVASRAGSTLDLTAGPYSEERTSFDTLTVTQRKQRTDNRWVEGSHVRQAVRENVEETLAVWIEADTHAAFDAAYRELAAVFDQRTFTLTITDLEDGTPVMTEVKTCFASDHTLTCNQEYRFARMGLLKATVERLPSTVVTYP